MRTADDSLASPRALRRILCTTVPVLLLVLACRSAPPVRPEDFLELRGQAMEAVKTKNYELAAHRFREALSIVPDHPTLLYNLAAVQALGGKRDDALDTLERLSSLNLYLPVSEDADFDSLKGERRFDRVLNRLSRNHRARSIRSDVAVRFFERGLIPEGLTRDPRDGAFYVGSVRQRRILHVDATGRVTEFAGPAEGLWSAMGMRIDPGGRFLWVASSAGPQMEGFQESDRGRSAILQFDLRSGRLIRAFPIADRENDHWLGDLTISSDGTVYASDSRQPEIYRLDPETGSMSLLLRDDRFRSLQGLDLSADGRTLYVADYSTGIYAIDLRSRRIRRIVGPVDATLVGIDGLYRCGGDLIAVQNGIDPARLVLLVLDPRRARVVRSEIIDVNHPSFDEPTLGVVTADGFFYIADSQWGALDAKGKLPPREELKDPVILQWKGACRSAATDR